MASVRFKTGSRKEIQTVALNKTGTQCIYQCFPPELGRWGRASAQSDQSLRCPHEESFGP